MTDAEYLRRQALMCIKLALQISNIGDGANLRKQALEYSLRAEALESAAAKGLAARHFASALRGMHFTNGLPLVKTKSMGG
jgi:hypothetical protein